MSKVNKAIKLSAVGAVLCLAGSGLWAMTHRTASFVGSRYVNVLDFGAKGDNVTDDASAFLAAFKKAHELHLPVYIPPREFLVDQTLEIQSGIVIVSEGGTIRHSRSDKDILASKNSELWSIQGPLTLVGTRTSPGQIDAETGLKIEGGKRYIVDKLTVQGFRGSGIDISIGDDHGRRGDRGKYAFISFLDNHVGLNIHDGTGSEYNLFTLMSFSGNDVATSIAAGSTIITAANIVDNANGVFLPDGVNEGHGIINASNINHNAGYNIMATEMSQGFSFNACHIYGDSPTKGIVQLSNSHGIQFTAGVLDAAVLNDGWGINFAADNFVSGRLFSVSGGNTSAFARINNFDSGDVLNGTLTNAVCAPLAQ